MKPAPPVITTRMCPPCRRPTLGISVTADGLDIYLGKPRANTDGRGRIAICLQE